MEWIEVAVRDVDGEAAEALSEVMAPHGQGGAVIERLVSRGMEGTPDPARLAVKIYLPADEAAPATLQRLREAIWHLSVIVPLPEPQITTLADEDWQNGWKKHYVRSRPGERLVVVPAWDVAPLAANELPVRIDPGMAFGTGTHPSSRLALILMEQVVLPGSRLFDVGCGSGILSIAALRLGATRVAASDIDPVALAATAENAARNGLEGRIERRAGSIDSFDGPFDVIVINILAEVIVSLLDDVRARLASGGRLLLSGIIDTREALVRDHLDVLDLAVVDERREGDWVALLATAR